MEYVQNMDEIRDIFDEYYKEKDNYFISIDRMKNDLGNMIDKIVLYGAGSAGIAFLHYLRDIDIYPLYFSDGNPNRWGEICEGVEVIDYHEIVSRLGENALVIVTINTDGVKYCKSFAESLREGGHGRVYDNLYESGCKNVIDYTRFRRCIDMFRGDKYNLPSCSDVYEMEKNENKICEAYRLMADPKSREVFEKIIRFRLIDDSVNIPSQPQDKQYFEYEFFRQRNDEIFVDCGAYNGISLKAFLDENNNNIRRYYGIEPDQDNYSKLEEYVSSLSGRICGELIILNKCVYDCETDLKLYSLAGPGSFLADIGTDWVSGIRIDRLTGDEGATFIKMNIEGSEIRAIKGAEKTIRNHKPRLAIAGYHKTRDIWEIPLLIQRFNSEYKIHLRSYMNNISFVFYAG